MPDLRSEAGPHPNPLPSPGRGNKMHVMRCVFFPERRDWRALLDFIHYMLDRRDVLRPEFFTHLKVVASALAIATVLGLGLGLIASRVQVLESALIGMGSAILTVPSFALFGI